MLCPVWRRGLDLAVLAEEGGHGWACELREHVVSLAVWKWRHEDGRKGVLHGEAELGMVAMVAASMGKGARADGEGLDLGVEWSGVRQTREACWIGRRRPEAAEA